MRIFVTGASGFLGQSLCEALRNRGDEVVGISSSQCDLTKSSSLHAFKQPFDLIYHLACWTQAGDFCLKHSAEQWIINQKINTHVLEWWAERQPQAKLIAMGTSCSYDPQLPLSEEYYMAGEPIDSLYTYAMTKRMLLAGCRALHKQYGLNYLYVVPSTLYGPNYHTDGRQLHFIFDLIKKIIEGSLYNQPVILWGDGYQKRELIHIQDFIKILLHLEKESNQIFNIGSGQEHSIRTFAQIICDYAGYDASKVVYDTSKYVGAKSKVLCIDKIKQRNFCPQISLEQGLKETIDWFRTTQFVGSLS
jgi:GDP-L-fucose synthase